MTRMREFRSKEYVPTKQMLKETWIKLERNLEEIELITRQVTAKKDLLPSKDTAFLFFLGSCFYDFYMIAEDSLLTVAMVLDKWVPNSLDWHERLVRQLKNPIPEKRPPFLSPSTAVLLMDYLYFYLSFHRRCFSLSFTRVEKMVENIEQLFHQLERDLLRIKMYIGP